MSLLFFLGVFVPTAVNSAPPSKDNVKIPQLTRSVKIFSELEVDLITALKNNNQVKLKSLPAEDFEMRYASEPGNPVPYFNWLANSLSEASKYTADMEQMSVHELGQTAIVNFLWLPAVSSGQIVTAKFSVVDVWKQEERSWKLAIRYISSAQAADAKFPGFVQNETIIEKRY